MTANHWKPSKIIRSTWSFLSIHSFMPNIPYSGGSYEKVLLFVLAVGISNVTALPTAHAADTDSGKAARTLRTTRESAGHTPVSALIHIIGALTAWPIHGGPEAVSVACVYSNAFCWRRCY